MTSQASERTRSTEPVETSTSVAVAAVVDTDKKKPAIPFLSPQITSYFVAGGVAGAASRTVVSPLERLKIIQQVQPQGENQYKGVWSSLARMWREEGFRGFMRGNGINCLRIVPYSAVQFTTYEQLKKWFTDYGSRQLDTPTRLICGALAGITSVCTTYPLDLVRSRLSIATASIPAHTPLTQSASPPGVKPALASGYHTSARVAAASTAQSGGVAQAFTQADLSVLGMTRKVMRDEGGVRALYRGLIPTAMGVAPYVGINFAAYEALRGVITPPGKSSIPRKLLCGALAGSISQTLTYPFDVLRRKMQVTGMNALGVKYNGAMDAMFSIVRTEGVKGLYRGLWPNLLKVAPSIATSFFTYELVKDLLGASPDKRPLSLPTILSDFSIANTVSNDDHRLLHGDHSLAHALGSTSGRLQDTSLPLHVDLEGTCRIGSLRDAGN
ncbi:mitochondrial carrier domain-containing protein [Irpex lacteus]|nr:mitochondrial carrier domain-containing protein [Irpex lacteus]